MRGEIEGRLARFGLSGEARKWLIKCLDPVGDIQCGGIPDSCAVPVMRPEYRVQYSISAPPGAASWDLMLWSIPGDVNSVAWVAAPAPANFGNGAVISGSTTGSIQLQPVYDAPGYTGYINTTTTANVSMRAIQALPYAFRHRYKSITCQLIASAVSDQGDVFAAQFPPIFTTDLSLHTLPVINTVTSQPNGAINYNTVLPTDENVLSLMAPERYQGAARDGVYMPLRLAGPTQPFAKAASCGHAVGTPSPPQGYAGAIVDISTIQYPAMATVCSNDVGSYSAVVAPVSYVYRFPDGQMTGNNAAYDTGFDNINQGVVIWRGLAGTAGGGSFGSSVLVKVVVGLEVVPRPSSVDRVYVLPAEAYEPRAMEAYYALAIELADAYPASYNSLGTILSTIGGIASRIWPILKPVVSPLAASAARAVLSAVEPKPSPPRVTYRPSSVASSKRMPRKQKKKRAPSASVRRRAR